MDIFYLRSPYPPPLRTGATRHVDRPWGAALSAKNANRRYWRRTYTRTTFVPQPPSIYWFRRLQPQRHLTNFKLRYCRMLRCSGVFALQVSARACSRCRQCSRPNIALGFDLPPLLCFLHQTGSPRVFHNIIMSTCRPWLLCCWSQVGWRFLLLPPFSRAGFW